MSLHLRSGVHVAISQQRTILLDAKSGRYIGLDPATDRAFRRAAYGTMATIDVSKLAPLFNAGLLVAEGLPGPIMVPAGPAKPTTTFERQGDCEIGIVLHCALLQLRANVLVRRRSLIEVGASLGRARASAASNPPADPSARLTAIVSAFEKLRFVFSPLDRCLPRSLAFCLMALHAGVSVDLVVGVCANPFAAHAWVQWNENVVGDTLDRVTQFTPIVAL